MYETACAVHLRHMNLQKYNAYPEYRPGQEKAVQDLLDAFQRCQENGCNVTELSAPVGSGKTIVLRSCGKALLDIYPDEITKVTYTTPLTSLVNQIKNDKMLKLPTVMGRSNYRCPTFPGLYADDCPYRSVALAKKRPQSCRSCPYNRARSAFRESSFGACTLDFYLYNHLETDVLIVDESSSLEDRLLDNFGIALPEQIDLQNLWNSIMDWMEVLEEEAEEYIERLEALNLNSSRRDLLNQIKDITKKLNTAQRTIAKCTRILRIIHEKHEFFIDSQRNFKLIRGTHPFNTMSKSVQFIIMASGTPTTSLICDNFLRVRAPHPIPVENRRVYYQPVGKMGRKQQDETIPAMAKKILQIHETYPRSTIVHCHSYGIAKKLKENMHHPAVLLQESGQRKEALTDFMNAQECIFLSVNYSEGIDLKGDKFQRNLIAKVPYPNLVDEWVVKRNEADKTKLKMDLWYRLSTAVDIQQASGRCTRDLNDYSETYILDENFGFFYKSNKNLFEPWFLEALVWDRDHKPTARVQPPELVSKNEKRIM